MIQVRGDKIAAATSSASLYDNVNNANSTPGKTGKSGDSIKIKEKQQQNETCQTTPKTANVATGTANVGSQVRKRFFLFFSQINLTLESFFFFLP